MKARFALGSFAAAVMGLWPTVEARQQPQFRSSTDVVRVYATAKDRSGHLITDLTADSFEVRDNGKLVPISSFSSAPQPITAAVLVDMTGVRFELLAFQQLRDGLSAFVDRFQPEDRATIVWFSNSEIVIPRAVTSDVPALKRTIDGEIRLERAYPRFADDIVSGRMNGAIVTFASGRPLWNAIGAAADAIAGEPGRKVVLVIANGNNTKLLAGFPRLREVKSILASDEFMVYGVHGFEPRYVDFGQQDQGDGSYEERTTTLQQIADVSGGGFWSAPFSSDQRKRQTGGMAGANANRNPLSLAFRSQLVSIIDELRHQYMVGFVPTLRDGKLGQIEVRTTREGATVWARKTYTAPAE